jgi:hypothetical protein
MHMTLLQWMDFIEELVNPISLWPEIYLRLIFPILKTLKNSKSIHTNSWTKIFLTRVNETKAVKSDFKIQSNFLI